MTQDMPAEFLTVTAAAQQVGVSRSTVSGWITSGYLPATRFDRRLHIRPADLAAAQTHVHVGTVVPAWRQDQRHAGMRLRALRETAGLSQIALAAASGLTHEVISRLETGKCWPKAATVRALAQALAVDPEHFVGYEPVGLTLMTVAAAASRLDVPASRVQTWLQAGLLPGTKVSGQWRVLAMVIDELARSGRLRGRSRRLDPRYRG